MRSSGRTKRELAVSAALIGAAAAQVMAEAEHACITDQENDELEAIGRRLHAIAGDLFDQSLPGRSRTVYEPCARAHIATLEAINAEHKDHP